MASQACNTIEVSPNLLLPTLGSRPSGKPPSTLGAVSAGVGLCVPKQPRLRTRDVLGSGFISFLPAKTDHGFIFSLPPPPQHSISKGNHYLYFFF